MKDHFLKALLVLLFLIVIFSFFYFDTAQFFTFDHLKDGQEIFEDFYYDNRLVTLVCFFLIYTTWTAFSLPLPFLLCMVGGAVFGVWTTTGLAAVGAAIGGTLAFLSTRYVFGAWAGRKFGPRIRSFGANIEKNAVNYLLFVRFVPGMPFFLVNILSGLTGIKSGTFFLTTLIGVIPLTLIEANAGRQLSQAEEMGDIFSFNNFISLGLLALLVLVPVIYKSIKGKKSLEPGNFA